MSFYFLKKVFNKENETFSHYDKIFGRSLNEKDLVHGKQIFFINYFLKQIVRIPNFK